MSPKLSTPKLARSFYARGDAVSVARKLLGKRLVVPDETGRRVSGIIVEAEAYMGPVDKASHAHGNRRTARNEAMYQAPATVYVFFIYGMYYHLNVVTTKESIPHAVLIRAIEPEEGIERMRERRGLHRLEQLTSGPGKLCIAFGIDRSYNMADLTGDRIWIEKARRIPESQIAEGPRIGIDYAEEYVNVPWRFWIKDNVFVSKRSGRRAT